MKAIIYNRFGPPEVLQIKNVKKPVPKTNEVIVRNYATTVAAEDPGFRKNPGFNGLIKPRKKILGLYFSGEVESVGKDVKLFKPGDKVYGSTGLQMGTNAQYFCIQEEAAIELKSENLTYDEAAAIPNGALTALPFLRDNARIKPGQKILINGASGTVGLSAVQLAKYFGAEVTGVCSSPNLELVKSFGAIDVIDYTKHDFTKSNKTWDIIFDAVGKSSFSKCKNVLTENGVYLTTFPTAGILFQKVFGLDKGQRADFAATGLRNKRKQKTDLKTIKSIVEEGKLKPAIDRKYTMEEIAEAHKYVATGHKKGDVVINID
ncbi:MAG: NAD(P)-dependent alcohol dehydrogenase [Bacteroidota bacterium]